MSELQRQAARKTALTRDNTNRLAAMPKGKNHWNWNPNPSVLTMHRRIHRKVGRAANYKCVDCDNQARDWSLNGKVYTDNVKDYSPRCRSCHVRRDDQNNDRASKVSFGLRKAYLEGRR